MKASEDKSEYSFDATVFKRRLKLLYSHWEGNTDLWGSCQAFVVVYYAHFDSYQKEKENECMWFSPQGSNFTLKSAALNKWLLGNRYPGTIMVFRKKQIDFLCAEKRKADFRSVRRCADEALSLKFVRHVVNKFPDRLSKLGDILGTISSSGPCVLGHIATESRFSDRSKDFTKTLHSSSLELTDITIGIAALLAVKETGELENVKTAAFLTTSAMKMSAVLNIEQAIDENEKVTYSELARETEIAILDPTRFDPDLKAEDVNICYSPIFQNGRNLDLQLTASSNNNLLCYDPGSVIICSLASSYKMYCVNVARTILIDSDPKQTTAYKVLLKAHEAAIGALKPENKASDVYKAALDVVGNEAPELAPNLTKSAGTVIVTGLCEPVLILDERIAIILKAGMVLNVSLGFQNLPANSGKAKSSGYALLLTDTVIVTPVGNEVVTSKATKAFKDVANFFNDVEGGEEEERVESNESLDSEATFRRLQKEDRRQNQAQLLLSLNKETTEHLRGRRFSSRTSNDLIACDLSQHVEPLIMVDHENKIVILPIYGCMVPFHISNVKEVSTYRFTKGIFVIRIIFKVSGPPLSRTKIFLKRASFQSKDRGHLDDVAEQIKTFLQDVSSESESAESNNHTEKYEDKRSLTQKSGPIQLTDLCISPPFPDDKNFKGDIFALDNCFSYLIQRLNISVLIFFSNIKHAIFQEAGEGMNTLLHFHLDNPIMVGDVKTKDVQFYVKCMGGIEKERIEWDYKNIQKQFGIFVDQVDRHWRGGRGPRHKPLDLQFEKPLMRFHGVFDETSAFIVSTSSCIAQLIKTPYRVVTLSEIAIVNLERVGLGLETFDMVMVFKDLKKFARIKSIPSGSLEDIEEWLNQENIKYFKSKIIRSWVTLLKSITSDPENFISGGGWECLILEDGDSND